LSFCKQPKELKERCVLAKEYVKRYDFKIKMVVDNMDNEFQQKFAAWPFRFYGIVLNENDNHVLGFKAQPKVNEKYAYDVSSIAEWLHSLNL